MQKIIVLTGAGMSAESGLKTFRDGDGLWNNYKIEEVASPHAWQQEPQVVLDFYNQRRKQLFEVEPNIAHYALVRLEDTFDVQIITQNVDDLHERAGSANVLHLHGEIKKVRSTMDESLVYQMDGWELKLGDFCEKGSQLRPHIVWFGESVPNFSKASEIVAKADILIVIGTSLTVYPAALLINEAPKESIKHLIDPNAPNNINLRNLTIHRKTAVDGLPELVKQLLQN
ncbi:MAG: NAD-dependent protein deacylase [Bacteroidetes bacterium HGW-Bacteroidetes-17]|jgi:NAD-dependent deacetylase|nr:MAG: NAD-dependent protein deacylase [Bacteroidetes bacterium HGW-Bacteroidetes-17]